MKKDSPDIRREIIFCASAVSQAICLAETKFNKNDSMKKKRQLINHGLTLVKIVIWRGKHAATCIQLYLMHRCSC